MELSNIKHGKTQRNSFRLIIASMIASNGIWIIIWKKYYLKNLSVAAV